ncbi:MAG: hypothetical protein QXM31_03300 [Candidatus Woesearchaeota archaeon]
MNDGMKSWMGKVLDNEVPLAEEKEDYLALAESGSETARNAYKNALLLHQNEEMLRAVVPELEEIVLRQDVRGLVAVAEKVSPFSSLLKEYNDGISFAKTSIGKRLPLVKKADDACRSAAKEIAARLYSAFCSKRTALEETDNIPTLEAIRVEMNAIADKYKVVKDSFRQVRLFADMDYYLTTMPKMAAVKEELDKIEAMLETDQSKNDFSDLKHRRKEISGRYFSGRLRRMSKSLRYKEGLMRCEILRTQIDDYISNFPMIKAEMDCLSTQNAALEGAVKLLEQWKNPEPDANAAEAISVVRKLFSVAPARSAGYACTRQAFNENRRLRKELHLLYANFRDSLDEAMGAGLSAIRELKEPQSIDSLDKSLDLIQASMKRLSGYKAVFSAMGQSEKAEDCDVQLDMLQTECDKQLESKKAYSMLSARVKDAKEKLKDVDALFTNPAMLEIDLEKILVLMNMPAISFPDCAVFSQLKDEYQSALIDGMNKAKAKAVYGVGKLVEFYEQPVMQTGDVSADALAVDNRICRIRDVILPELKKTFEKHMPIRTYEQRLNTALQGFTAQQNSIREAKARREELGHKITLIKSALESFDTEALTAYAQWPSAAVENPYTSELAKEYSALVQHLQEVQVAAKPVPRPKVPYLNESVSVNSRARPKAFNMFAYVNHEMKEPQSKALKELRNELLCGNIHERLGFLESTLKKVADAPLDTQDNDWLSMLKRAYARDITEGYLSQSKNFNVPAERLQRISALFEKYVR